MFSEAAGKVLDVTEAGVVRAGTTCQKLGAWVVPFFYRREYGRIAQENREALERREQEESIVRGIGEMILGTHQGRIDVGHEEIDAVLEAVRPTIHEVGYSDVFDPLRARLLDKIAPLQEPPEPPGAG